MRVLAWLAALLAGAAGLGFEALLIGASGTCLGYASSAAIGLAVFLAAWAFGAWCAARVVPTPARIVAVGAGLAVAGSVGTFALLRTGASGASFAVAACVAVAAIGLVAWLQGFLLPWIAAVERAGSGARARDVAALYGSNLVGSAVGAHALAGELVGSHGRLAAAFASGALALVAALLAARLLARASSASGGVSSSSPTEPSDDRVAASSGPELSFARAALVVGLATGWVATNEWIGLRLCALWLGGMEPALRAALVAALVALAVGALLLPRVLPRGPRGVVVALVLAALGAAWFASFAPVLGTVPAANDALRGVLVALAITGPPLVALGAIVPLVHRSLATPTPVALGRLLLHEAWGALVAIPLAHFVLVPRGGLALAAAFGVAFGAAAVLACGRAAPRLALVALLVCGASTTRLLFAPPFSASAPAYLNPALTVLTLREDREFAVAVVDDGVRGERTLFTDGFRAAGTGREYRYMQVLGHLPILLHPEPKRVAVLALGTGTTLGSVAAHPEVEAVDVLEIAPAVVAAAPWFEAKNGGVLAREPQRVRVLLGDGRRTLADHPETYDVITMEPLLPDSPFGVYLYTSEFYGVARRALRPGGLLCQWVPPHALEPATFRSVLATFGAAFPWSGVWLAGTQVVLVGGASEPALDRARFPTGGALGTTLETLGLDSPEGVAARYVGPPHFDASEPHVLLSDEHPWIVYRPRRSGATLLADLPDNLTSLRADRAPLPERWSATVGSAGIDLRAGIAEVQRARAAQASEEARQRGLARADASVTLREALALARRLARTDPERLEFEAELEFLEVVRRGVSSLAAGDAQGAQLALERAVELRPERADVALYLAVARERAGDPDASAAVERAAALCPGLARTPEGLRARALGLSDAAWRRLEERAAAAGRR